MRTFSHMKYPIRMSNEFVQNFTCEILAFKTCIVTREMEDSLMKINFTNEIFSSHAGIETIHI